MRIRSGWHVLFFEDAIKRHDITDLVNYYRTIVEYSLRSCGWILLEPVRLLTLSKGERIYRVAGPLSMVHECEAQGGVVFEDAWAAAALLRPLYSESVWPEAEELGVPRKIEGCRIGDGEIRILGTDGDVKKGETSSEDPLHPSVQGLVGEVIEFQVHEELKPEPRHRVLLTVGKSPVLLRDIVTGRYIVLGEPLDPFYRKLFRANLILSACGLHG